MLFVGREAELDLLDREMALALQIPAGRAIFVEGSAGTGKSALVAEFLARTAAQRPEVAIARGRCLQTFGSADPYLPFVEAIRDLSDDETTGSIKSEKVSELLAELAPYWLSVVPVVGGLLSATFATAARLKGQSIGSAPSREALFVQYLELIKKLAAQSPLLLVLDDLHWADPSSVALLAHLSRGVANLPVLIVGTLRRTEAELEKHPVVELIRELEREDSARRVPLPEMDAALVHALLRAEFGGEVAEPLSRWMLQTAGGNPLFLSELARLTRQNGAASEQNGEWHLTAAADGIEVPRSAEAVIESRIQHLDPEEVRLLQYASVEGIDFNSTVVAKLLERDELEVLDALDAMERRYQLVKTVGEVELPDGDVATTYTFRSALTQTVLYRQVVGKRRILLHRKAGEMIESIFPDALDDVAGKLARHFHFGRVKDTAHRYARQAAERARAVYAHWEAEELFRIALENSTDDEERADLEERLGDVYDAVGYYERGIEGYGSSLARRAADAAASLRLRRKIVVLERKAGLAPAPLLLQRMRALLAEAADHPRESCLLLLESVTEMPDAVETQATVQQALRIAESDGDTPLILMALERLAYVVLFFSDRVEEALTYLQRAREMIVHGRPAAHGAVPYHDRDPPRPSRSLPGGGHGVRGGRGNRRAGRQAAFDRRRLQQPGRAAHAHGSVCRGGERAAEGAPDPPASRPLHAGGVAAQPRGNGAAIGRPAACYRAPRRVGRIRARVRDLELRGGRQGRPGALPGAGRAAGRGAGGGGGGRGRDRRPRRMVRGPGVRRNPAGAPGRGGRPPRRRERPPGKGGRDPRRLRRLRLGEGGDRARAPAGIDGSGGGADRPRADPRPDDRFPGRRRTGDPGPAAAAGVAARRFGGGEVGMSEVSTFAGRVEALHALFRNLSRAGGHEPRLVLVEGAAGRGKSALLGEFARRLAVHPREVAVVTVAAPADGAYDPVKLAARKVSKNQMYERVGGRRQAMESARELLPDWLGAIPVIGELIAAIVATVQILRERRRAKNISPISGDDETDALIDASARRPLVLLLDDVEALERPAAARLEALLRAAEGRARILIVGAATPVAPGTRPTPLQEMVAALPPALVARIDLRELTAPEITAWLRKRFPHVDIPATFLDWLRSATGGNPAAVDAMLDRLAERSVIRFVDRHWEIGEPPADMEAPAAAAPAVELSGLKPATLELLEAASAIGEEFDSLTLSRLVERDELHVEDHLAYAIRHGLVESIGEAEVDDDVATLYRFRSAHLCSSLHRALPAERRAELERRRAELANPV